MFRRASGPDQAGHGAAVRPSVQLRSQLGQLPDAERRVAELLLAEPQSVIHDSVGRLSARADASPATVVRLSRRLGFDGFAALKIAMAQEAGGGSPFGHPANDATTPGSMFQRVMASDAESVLGSARTIDPAAFARAEAALAAASSVLFAGVGASAALAALCVSRFCPLGVRAASSPDALTQHLLAANLGPGDVCVAISHTGESRDTIAAATTARQSDAVTIGVTSFAGSPLTQAVDVSLICAHEADAAHRELFANPVAIVSALGALHAAVTAALPSSSAPAAAARLIASHQY
jgi:RpiR family transcriptional regulator, carbohydrate utilization regulator